jgi:hypothetical protein
LRSDGKSETGAASAFEGSKSLQDLTGPAGFAGMFLAIFFRCCANDLFDLRRGLICDEEWNIVGAPDIEKREVLNVVGEELCLELVAYKSAEGQKQERTHEGQR